MTRTARSGTLSSGHMQNIVIDKPYVPVPPHRGRIWPAILSLYLPRLLRRKYGVVEVKCLNAERLAQSIAAGHGVLITPNHCRDEDPLVLGMLSRKVRSPFFIIASWHLFMQDRMQTFLLRRAGAFSIYREGIDRAAVNTSVEILETARRPLVIFPEGHISRTNDRLNDLMDGTALIARSAAKKRAKLQPPGKVVVHPVAVRYRFAGDAQAAVASVLDDIEARLTWRKQERIPLVDRIYRTGGALLALKELEYLSEARGGDVATRLTYLIDAILVPLEQQWLNGKQDDGVPARVKRLRSAILPDMTKDQINEEERQKRWTQLADLYLAQQLFHYPPDYVRSNPTPERLLETVERFEEDLTDRVRVHGPIHAQITVGEAIEVSPTREGRGGNDPLMEQVESELRTMLGLESGS
ncbi:MAG TPA: 1-acyl-sn-glycerol-3-phosphate acyltransferase [Tepidisphaeraceae bacterium]|nr:1-acyl-sn-glycerol-3-phosphate acyltransferase [Tepidisphaeraceae bacterium]